MLLNLCIYTVVESEFLLHKSDIILLSILSGLDKSP